MAHSGPDQVRAPVPYKASLISNRIQFEDDRLDLCPQVDNSKHCTVTNCCKVLSLDQLIDDCFRCSIGELHDESRVERVEAFRKIVVRLHCEENLAFLIDLYKYEYYYAKIYPQDFRNCMESSSSHSPKHTFLNRSLSLSLHDLPYPTKIRKQSFHKRAPSSVVMSLNSDDHEPPSVFASSIDDLEPSRDIKTTWDNFRDKSTEVETDNDSDEESGVEVDEDKILSNQWNHILFTYVRHDSPLQINLSDASYKEIMEADKSKEKIVNPSVLHRVQLEIFQLIKENVYIPFINSNRENKDTIDSPTECISPVPREPITSLSPQVSSRGIESPALSPSPSDSKLRQKKNRFLPFSSPQLHAESSSTSSSASSITNFFSHLKLTSPTSSRSHTPVFGSPPSTVSSPIPFSHLAGSSSRKVAAQDAGKSQSHKLNKLWKKKP